MDGQLSRWVQEKWPPFGFFAPAGGLEPNWIQPSGGALYGDPYDNNGYYDKNENFSK